MIKIHFSPTFKQPFTLHKVTSTLTIRYHIVLSRLDSRERSHYKPLTMIMTNNFFLKEGIKLGDCIIRRIKLCISRKPLYSQFFWKNLYSNENEWNQKRITSVWDVSECQNIFWYSIFTINIFFNQLIFIIRVSNCLQIFHAIVSSLTARSVCMKQW